MNRRIRMVMMTAACAAVLPLDGHSAGRSAEAIVQQQCITCHGPGLEGAPRIGDREAWIPRLRNGLDAMVRNATHGHGHMPARGGMPQLTDAEFRAAVVYLYDPGSEARSKALPQKAASPLDPYRKVIAGTEIILGVADAESLRRQGGEAARLHGGVPSGSGYYHLIVALHDAATGKDIGDATVEARVASPLGSETKMLEPMAIDATMTYGNYFRMLGSGTYSITVEVRKAGETQPIEAKFDFRR
jgi:cytochrome c5